MKLNSNDSGPICPFDPASSIYGSAWSLITTKAPQKNNGTFKKTSVYNPKLNKEINKTPSKIIKLKIFFTNIISKHIDCKE
jgi:hypothetical protein